MIGRRAPLALSAVGAMILAVSLGLAADLRVLLLGPSPSDPTVVRVRQELMLLGLEVEIATDPGSKLDLAALAKDHGAAAVARVEDTPPEIVLWVDPAHSGGQPQESRVSDTLSGRNEPGLLALRAVELLRGRLVPVPATAPTASPSASASASASAKAAASSAPSSDASARPSAAPSVPPPVRLPRGSLHLGPAILGSPGGVPVTPSLRLGGGWRIIAPVEVNGLALIPLSVGGVVAEEGQIDLRVLAFGAGVNVYFTNPVSAFSLHAGAGLGVMGFLFEGRAIPPWRSASGTAWSALPYLEVGAGYRISPVLSIRADVLGSLALPEAVLRVAGQDVASFGEPAIFGSLSLEVHP